MALTKDEWRIKSYQKFYDISKTSTEIIGLNFYLKENNGRLTLKEIAKVCERAMIRAYAEYDPKMKYEFVWFKESVIKHALAHAIIMKENQKLNEYYEILVCAEEGSPEEKLYEEYKKHGVTPLVKQHVMEFYLKKKRQYRERGNAERQLDTTYYSAENSDE